MITDDVSICFLAEEKKPRHLKFYIWQDPPVPNDAGPNFVCAWWFAVSEVDDVGTENPLYDAMAETFNEIKLYPERYASGDLTWTNEATGEVVQLATIAKTFR